MFTARPMAAGALAAVACALCACTHAPDAKAKPIGMGQQLQDARNAYLNGQISKQEYERERAAITHR
jgi:hypothetical protein